MNPSEQGGPRETLSQFVASLHRDYEIWYAKSVRRVNRSYWILQMTVLLSGFATSVLGALIQKENVTWFRWIIVAVPAIGSLAAAFLLQFRTYELWRLREQGRIGFQDLAITGQRLLAAASSDQQCSEIHAQLQARTTEIEQSQSSSYFGLFRSDFVAAFNSRDSADVQSRRAVPNEAS